ncbi:MAG: hypothetical protein GX077_02950 [Tissierellia bacterium]|nr:hypothetical protein [Tissierellia bacterium]
MKIIGHIIFIILFLLISFFGIGPVLMADGTSEERILTLIIVLLIYGIWFLLYRYFIRKMKKY